MVKLARFCTFSLWVTLALFKSEHLYSNELYSCRDDKGRWDRVHGKFKFITNDVVNVRRAPGIRCERSTQLPRGVIIEPTRTLKNEWFEFKYKDDDGRLHRGWVHKVGLSTPQQVAKEEGGTADGCSEGHILRTEKNLKEFDYPRLITVPYYSHYNFGSEWKEIKSVPVFAGAKLGSRSNRLCDPVYRLNPGERFVGISKGLDFSKIAYLDRETGSIRYGWLTSILFPSDYFHYWPHYKTWKESRFWEDAIEGYDVGKEYVFTKKTRLKYGSEGIPHDFNKGDLITMRYFTGKELNLYSTVTDHRYLKNYEAHFWYGGKNLILLEEWQDTIASKNAQKQAAVKYGLIVAGIYCVLMLITRRGRYVLDLSGYWLFKEVPGIGIVLTILSGIFFFASYYYFSRSYGWQDGIEADLNINLFLWFAVPMILLLPFFIYFTYVFLKVLFAPLTARRIGAKMSPRRGRPVDHSKITASIGGTERTTYKTGFGLRAEATRARNISEVFAAQAQAHRMHQAAAKEKMKADILREYSKNE